MDITRFLRRRTVVAAFFGTSLFFSGCATAPTDSGFVRPLKETFASDDPCSNNARNTGLVVGAVGGALLGKAMGGNTNSALIGAVAGATLGGFIGSDMDRRRCELYRIAEKYRLEATVETIEMSQTMQVEGPMAPGSVEQVAVQPQTAPSGVSSREHSGPEEKQTLGFSIAFTDKAEGGLFQSGSARLTPEAEKYFGEVADLYNREKRMAAAKTPEERKAIVGTRLLLIGHTDDEGSSRYNADLSEQRARAVARFLSERGVPEDSLYFQGAGETFPIADNRTPEGRAKNRRVELVELVDERALSNYLDRRMPRIEFYRPVTVPAMPGRGAANSPQAPVAIAPKNETTARAQRPMTPVDGRAAAGRPASPPEVQARSGWLNLGGVPARGVKVDFGELIVSRPGFSLIRPAYAEADELVRDCAADRPRVAHGVKSLRGELEFRTREYLPGLYGSSWADLVNGHLLALNKVAVLKDAGSPARAPELLIYRDYASSKSKPLRLSPQVNTYRGSKGILYRLFVQSDDTGIQCIDVVFPYQPPFVARDGYVFQERGGTRYAARYVPRIAQ